MLKEKIIVALDLNRLEEIKRIVHTLDDALFFKVGLQSFLLCGPKLLPYLKKQKKKIFLDLKFFDIPNTVSSAIISCRQWQPDFITVHLSGGLTMLKKAAEAACEIKTTILGVTVLTSFDQQELNRVGINSKLGDQVLRLAELGLQAKINHFVCSPQEIELLKKHFGNDIRLITPGVRPSWSAKDDQQRVLTPREAFEKGAAYIVIGRPLLKHPDPETAWKLLVQEIS